jgi:hypothetical protein
VRRSQAKKGAIFGTACRVLYAALGTAEESNMRAGWFAGCLLVVVACGSSDDGSDLNSTTGGNAGSGAAAGSSGSGAAGGTAGTTSTGGSGGSAASGASAGVAGAGNLGGSGADAGAGGTAGAAGSAGAGGTSSGGTSGGGGTGGTSGSGGTGGFAGNGFVVDRTSIALFDQIPEQYVTAARGLKMMFSDRSVGQNINEALDCLASASWEQSPSSCRRDYVPGTDYQQTKLYTATDLAAGTVPPRIQFPASSTKYNRSNWVFEFRMGTWTELTTDFITLLAPTHVSTKSVLSYQFSYLNVMDGDDIASPTSGFFANNANKPDVFDLEAYIAQHPSKTFIFWTTSLARAIGTKTATEFNAQMRQYAAQNGKILLDFADIISHTDTGVPCYDNNTTDGADYPAICRDYTTEVNGGHLGSVSGGKILAAKAFWVAMARIAGWNPPGAGN